MKNCFVLFLISILCFSCSSKNKETGENLVLHENAYTNPIREVGAEPWAAYYKGIYYYTQGTESNITLWKTNDLTHMNDSTPSKVVWQPTDPDNSSHLWAPEIHRINNKWYIYYAADDGNMDNHQIYVIENDSEDPMKGTFKMKGRISTDEDNNWAIHANVFEHKGIHYMIWSGWQKQRIESETQCIYIASMENPWTLSSERVLISKPTYEWECQWVNPDGSKTAYTIHVNEAPQFLKPQNKEKICIAYSASGSWTPYYCMGLLTADANADLLNPANWKKSGSPVFVQDPESEIYGPGGGSFISSPDGEECFMLYHARKIPNDAPGASDSRSPRMQKIEWDAEGMPVFGKPYSEQTLLRKPSESKIAK